MKRKSVSISPRCPIRTTLDLIGGKWKLLIIYQLALEPLRPSELKRIIPDISEKMLNQELKLLVESQLVVRKNFGEVPPRVVYELSDTGKKALDIISKMKDFASEYEKTIMNLEKN